MTESNQSPAETDRLFVPLSSEPWYAFKRGEKAAEFRGVNDQFNRETVFEGRPVELRRGYSTDDSLWGTITDVDVGSEIDSLVVEWFDALQYDDRSLDEVMASVREFVGDYDEFIVFAVELDDRNSNTQTDQTGTINE